MPKVKISEFSSTPANNTDIDSINIAEGCAPSGINDAIRELMAQLKDFQTGAVGDSFNGPVGSTTASTGAFTTLSASGAVTLSGGTANGVAYLNGSKVVTSGSALTFNGTQLGVVNGAGSAILKLDGSSAPEIDFVSSGVVKSYIYAPSTSLQLNTVGANPIIFLPNEVEAMRLTSTGLGIGTSSPSAKLTIAQSSNVITQGLLLVNAAGTQNGGWYHGGSALIGRENGTDTIALASGNVGIGTSSPAAKLHIKGSSNPAIYWENSSFGSATNAAFMGSAGQLVFGRAGAADWMTLDNSGNLGLGVTPSAGGANANYRLFEIGLGGGGSLYSGGGQTLFCTNVAWSGGTANYKASSIAPLMYSQESGTHIWKIAPSGTAGNAITFSQAMTLDSSGNLLVGTTSGVARLTVVESSNLSEADAHFEIIGNGYSAFAWLDGTAYYIGQNSASRSLRIYSSDETAGVNLAAGGTSWGTFSDERLKYDIEPITDGLTKLANVRCVSYRLKDVDAEDSQKKLGVIAQDLVGVVDEVIDITKRSNDDTEYMSVRYTELVPVLIKAIQEQQALIESLKARLDAANL